MGIFKTSFLAIATNAPHPNAAKLFISFILTEDGFAPWNELGTLPGGRRDIRQRRQPAAGGASASGVGDGSNLRLEQRQQGARLLGRQRCWRRRSSQTGRTRPTWVSLDTDALCPCPKIPANPHWDATRDAHERVPCVQWTAGAETVPDVKVECSHHAATEPMTIQAVFFDMGGTIETFWYSRESRLRATPGLRQRLLSAGIELPWTDEQLYEVVATGLERYHQRSLVSLDELPPARVWREFVFADHAVDPLRLEAAGEDLMLYVETRFYERAMRPESPEVLDAIRRMGLKIGLISNVCSHGQVPLCLNEYGLRSFFDPVVLSSEYGRRKPDPSIFHYAARLAETPTSACAYVGDRVSRDIKGSRAAGYGLSVQIRHDFRHNEDDQGPAPDETIDSLAELVEILRREQSPQAQRSRPRPDPNLRVRALLFDAGDILYRRPAKGRCLAEFLTARGLNVKDVPVEVVRSLREGAYRGELGQEQYRRALLGLYGVIDSAAVEQGMRALEQDDQSVRIIDGVAETLIRLKARGYLSGDHHRHGSAHACQTGLVRRRGVWPRLGLLHLLQGAGNPETGCAHLPRRLATAGPVAGTIRLRGSRAGGARRGAGDRHAYDRLQP